MRWLTPISPANAVCVKPAFFLSSAAVPAVDVGRA
jgi:hypothetical protein